MKIICRFISFALFLIVIIIAFLNSAGIINIETSFLSMKLNTGFLIFACSLVSCLSTLILFAPHFLSGFEKKKFKKQAEHAKLNYEIESEKVKQLEAKIKTLEEALKIATKSKNS